MSIQWLLAKAPGFRALNAFQERFEVASKTLDSSLLAHVQSAMVAQRVQMSEDEALVLWPRIKRFREQEGREPNVHSPDPKEQRLAEAHAWLKNRKAKMMQARAL